MCNLLCAIAEKERDRENRRNIKFKTVCRVKSVECRERQTDGKDQEQWHSKHLSLLFPIHI